MQNEGALPESILSVESKGAISAKSGSVRNITKKGKGMFLKLPDGSLFFLTVLHLSGSEIFLVSKEKKYSAKEETRSESHDLLLLSVADFPMETVKVFQKSQQKIQEGDSLFFSQGEKGILRTAHQYFSLQKNFPPFPLIWEVEGIKRTLGDSGEPVFDMHGNVAGIIVGIGEEGKERVYIVPLSQFPESLLPPKK